MDLHLAGRTALVTGSYRGTGAGIARILAGEGAQVLVHGFEDGQPDDVVASIVAAGGAATGVVADIATDAGSASLGGLGHALPYLIPDFWTATTIAIIVVFFELWAIAWIQNRYMETPFFRAALQVVLGGALVLAAGILIGSG